MVSSNDSVCDTLYKSYIFFSRDNNGYIIQQIILSILSIIIILCLYYWLYSRQQHINRGNIDKANGIFLHVYRNIIIIYIIIMSIQFILLLIYIFLIDITKIIKIDSLLNIILYSFIYTLSIFQFSLIMFLFTKNTLSLRAFYRSIKLSLPFSILCYIFYVLSYYFNKVSSISLLILYIFLLFCCLLLLFRQCSYHWPRKSIINRYVLLIIIICILNIFISILSFNKSKIQCIQQFNLYIWYLLYPLILFKTIRDDSIYWWTSSSEPLLGSTKKSLAAIDLFTLPPYHEVHFQSNHHHQQTTNNNNNNNQQQTTNNNNDDDNDDERFNKLSQIVSSQVKMIPFDKIKLSTKKLGISGNNTIGKGSTSKVYRATYKKHDVAVKCLTKIDNDNNNNMKNWTDLTLIFRESILSSTISHFNIVKFYGVSLNKQNIYLLYEYCLFGDLQFIIVDDGHPNNPNIKSIYQRLFYLNDIAQGMKFLHEHQFVHRDLKTANVVVSYSKINKRSRYIAKICDFGVSRRISKKEQENKQNDNNNNDDEIVEVIDKQQTTELNENNINFVEIDRTISIGTPAFLAPEILLKLVKQKGIRFSQTNSSYTDPLISCDFATDVYSFGMIVYSLITSKLPYKGYKPMDMILMIKKSKRLKISDNEWNEWIPYVSNIKHLKLLLNSSWSQHATQRPSFQQICLLLNQIAKDQFA